MSHTYTVGPAGQAYVTVYSADSEDEAVVAAREMVEGLDAQDTEVEFNGSLFFLSINPEALDTVEHDDQCISESHDEED